MTQAQLVNNIRNSVSATLNLIEQAQAKAAAEVQEYNAMGGATALTGFDWQTVDVTEAQVGNAMYSLGLIADILGGNAANLYPVK
jgi:hypothetical protein